MTGPRGLLGRMHGEETGSIGLMVAVLALALLAMVGLVVDGAGKARALTRADDVAGAAARAGAQAVDLVGVRAGDSTGVAPARARNAVRDFLSAAGMTGTVSVTDAGRTLHVTAATSYDPVFLGAIGVGPMTVTGAATIDLSEVQLGELR